MDLADLQRKFIGRAPGILGVREHYAVLVPVLEQAGEPTLLFEVRAGNLRRQPGEVCFPGGRVEPGESYEQCALRETWEELGIPAEAIHIIAHLDILHHQGNFALHPILARVDAAVPIRLEAAEVEETFSVPLSFLTRHEPEVYTYPLEPMVGEDFPYDRIHQTPDYPWKTGSLELPIYTYGRRVIWGMTARIVRSLVSP